MKHKMPSRLAYTSARKAFLWRDIWETDLCRRVSRPAQLSLPSPVRNRNGQEQSNTADDGCDWLSDRRWRQSSESARIVTIVCSGEADQKDGIMFVSHDDAVLITIVLNNLIITSEMAPLRNTMRYPRSPGSYGYNLQRQLRSTVARASNTRA